MPIYLFVFTMFVITQHSLWVCLSMSLSAFYLVYYFYVSYSESVWKHDMMRDPLEKREKKKKERKKDINGVTQNDSGSIS